ncbi:multidrug resistance-associated protein 4-like protein, partial [Leptotrombidium deliense]
MHLFDHSFLNQELCLMSQPLLIGVIIRYFASDSKVSLSDARNAALGICLTLVLYSVVRHQYFLFTNRALLRVRTALSVLLFEKILKIKRTATETSVGQILNVMSNDINCFDDVCWIFSFLVIAPIELIIVYLILWTYIGYSCLMGLLIVFCILLFQIGTIRFLAKYRLATVKLTDSRVKLMSEIINAIKVIKMYAWESSFAAKISNIRSQEIKQLKKSMYIKVPTFTIAETATKILVFVTIVSVLFFGFELNSEITFVTVALFNVIRIPVTFHLPLGIGYITELFVACKRIRKILLIEEKTNYTNEYLTLKSGEVNLNNFCCRWSKVCEKMSLSDVSLHIQPGELVIVIGPVGSGKTCLLLSLLNEVEKVSGKCEVSGKVAYASQEAWCFSGSIKENIVFGRDFDQRKYSDTVDVCCLSKDLKKFAFGDETLI